MKISVVVIVLGIFVVGILTYVSVLGENHKINRVINSYFGKLKDGMYLEACESYSSHLQQGQLAREEDNLNFNFLLELSLLKYYNLIDQDDYNVELKRSNFWIPFVSDDSVYVSIALKPKEDKEILDILSSDQSRNPIENLIIVVREKGTWKIREFTIADSSVGGIYNDLRQNVDLNKYVKMTPHGLQLKNAEINFKTLSPIDRRLLKFSLHKIRKSQDAGSKRDN
ncbi:MAG: hypothetical protein JXA50_02020 [Deltaproteobacteria bacterium]|nr:hypothetical protein [Deltaproteobacteria bacterium]